MSKEFKAPTYFLRPHWVYFSLFFIAVIHVLASLIEVRPGIQLVINSLSCLYVGAMSTSKIKFNKQKNSLEKVEREQTEEKMTQKDALQFPLYLSCYLFGLYTLFKYIDERLVAAALTLFFSFLGCLCLMGIIEDAIERLFPIEFSTEIIIEKKYSINLVFTKKDFEIKLTKMNILSFALTLLPLGYYLSTKSWICNNIFGIAFSIQGVANFNVIPNFKIAYLMLWGLFFYDIFWVFGTDVMVTVAKLADAPIKLQFPFQILEDGVLIQKYSMLGLGDIVVPGIFVSMCLQFDVDRQIKKARSLNDIDIGYFTWCFIGYIIGILATLSSMIIFNHPQPALLFLVPGCTLSVLIKAFLNKQLPEFWAYDQEKKPELEVEKNKAT
ncbi:hypothetical protein pb186bvf_006957 [Paramecium bursaria]